MTRKPRIALKFLRHLFSEGLLINNPESSKPYTKWYYQTDYTKCNFYKVKNCTHLGIISKSFPFLKVKLKWPLSRGSHFKIQFSLEFQGNQGSSQNFHGVPLSGDCKIITRVTQLFYFFIINAYYTYLKHEI